MGPAAKEAVPTLKSLATIDEYGPVREAAKEALLRIQ
jgi:hypothetical protein